MTLGLFDVAFVGALPRYDADAQDYINRVIAADVAAGNNSGLESGVQDAYNAFFVACKSDGMLNAIKASCIMAGARTLQGCLVPLVGTAPTNFNFESGDYNRKTGLVGDGSTKSLLANYTLLSTTASSTHFSYYQTQAQSASTSVIIGSWNAGQTVEAVWISGVIYLFSRDVSYLSVAQTNGFIGHARSNNTTVTTRADGTSVVASSNIVSPQYDMPMRVFARNNIPGNVANFYSNARLAFYSIGESLDLALLDARVTGLINAIAAVIP